MTDELLKKLRSFCKSIKITDKSLSELWTIFSDRKGCLYFEREAFERGMEELNVAPVKKVREKVAEYVKTDGPDCWSKFTKEQQFITRNFWYKLVEDISLPTTQNDSLAPAVIEIEQDGDSYEKLLPKNWMRMPLSERIDFVEKVQHPGFYQYLLIKDVRIKEFFKKAKSSSKTPLKMYVLVFSFPSDNYSEEAKNLLKCFIEILNQIGRTSLQYVECTNPNVVEIREVR